MEHMQEDEFDAIPMNNTHECPPHKVVKLYYLGMHSDYGCIYCKRKSLILKDFETKDSN